MDSDNPNNKVDISALPFSQACENNKAPILNVLQKELQEHTHVLEVGSGTGQHSVYFAPRLPHLQWQTSDVTDNHQVIQAWHDAYPASNLYAPLAFNLLTDSIPKTNTGEPYDAIFTANTLHIIAWPLRLCSSVRVLPSLFEVCYQWHIFSSGSARSSSTAAPFSTP